MLINVIFILISIILGVIGQLVIKHGTTAVGAFDFSDAINFLKAAFTNFYIWAGLGCYVLSSITWIITLSRVELSYAYPMVSIGYVLVLFFSSWFFGEKVLPIHYAGVALIIAGVVLITKGR